MTLTFVHGFLGASSMWGPTIDALKTQHPCELLTLPGHGRHPWTSAATYDDAVAHLQSSLPPTPTVVIGYSMGARLLLSMLAHHRPTQVMGAVLIGVHPGLLEADARQTRMNTEEGWAEQLEEDGLVAFVDRWETMPVFATQSALPPDVRAARRLERLGHTTQGLAWALRTLGLGRMKPVWHLGYVGVPIRLVTGALDAKFTKIGQVMARGLDRVSHVIAPDAGHDVALEAPQRLAPILEDFFATVEKARGTRGGGDLHRRPPPRPSHDDTDAEHHLPHNPKPEHSSSEGSPA